MPGKHAPRSPLSFFLSLSRAAAFALAVLGLVVLIAMVAVNSRDQGEQAFDQPRSSVTPTPSSPTSRASPSPTPTASRTLVPKSKLTVVVLNGNRVAGLAGQTSDRLEDDDYDVQEPGNTGTTSTSLIYYRSGLKAEAEVLRRKHFPWMDRSRVKQRTSGLPDEMLVVVLGTDHPDA